MIYGYMRTSTDDQCFSLQEDALKRAGCEEIVSDRMSGRSRVRPGLDGLLAKLQQGDTLIVWKLDRLGRSLSHLIGLIEQLGERGIEFRSLTENIDTTTPSGRCMFHMIGAFAQMEREIIAERVKAGVAAKRAKQNGEWGRKWSVDKETRGRIKRARGSVRGLAERFGVSRGVVERVRAG